MKNKIKYTLIIITITITILITTSCNTNYDIQKNSFQTFNYVYIISENKYIKINSWIISDYGTLKFTDEKNIHYCICQGNWILYENI